MKPAQRKLLSNPGFILGFASVLDSISIGFMTGVKSPETQAHTERFGIFAGLRAPAFFYPESL